MFFAFTTVVFLSTKTLGGSSSSKSSSQISYPPPTQQAPEFFASAWYNFWKLDDRPKSTELFLVTDKYCQGKCDSDNFGTKCRPMFLDRTLYWSKHKSVHPMGGRMPHTEHTIMLDAVSPQSQNVNHLVTSYTTATPKKQEKLCSQYEKSLSRNWMQWGVEPEATIFISWGQRMQSEEEIKGVIREKWDSVVKKSIPGVGPLKFCDWHRNDSNQDCNVIISDSPVKTYPQTPHVQVIVAQKNTQNNPLKGGQLRTDGHGCTWNDVVTKSQHWLPNYNYVLDSLFACIWGKTQTLDLYRTLDSVKLREDDRDCWKKFRGKKKTWQYNDSCVRRWCERNQQTGQCNMIRPGWVIDPNEKISETSIPMSFYVCFWNQNCNDLPLIDWTLFESMSDYEAFLKSNNTRDNDSTSH